MKMNSSEEFQNVDSARVAILELIDKRENQKVQMKPTTEVCRSFLTQQPISDRQSRENF